MWRGRAERGAASSAALGVLAVGYGLAVLTGAHALEAAAAEPPASWRELAADVVRTEANWGIDWGWATYEAAYHDLAMTLVVKVQVVAREPRDFGSWPAHDDFYADEAPDDGSIAQWSEHYYVTHNWSEYGKQILTMREGDTVEVGGVRMQVDGAFDYPNDGKLGQILSVVGDDAVVLQTCDDGIDLTRIVYGHEL